MIVEIADRISGDSVAHRMSLNGEGGYDSWRKLLECFVRDLNDCGPRTAWKHAASVVGWENRSSTEAVVYFIGNIDEWTGFELAGIENPRVAHLRLAAGYMGVRVDELRLESREIVTLSYDEIAARSCFLEGCTPISMMEMVLIGSVGEAARRGVIDALSMACRLSDWAVGRIPFDFSLMWDGSCCRLSRPLNAQLAVEALWVWRQIYWEDSVRISWS